MKRKSKFTSLKRATVTVALFFQIQARGAPAETYRDIIEKAYNLSLQKDRNQAVSILLNSLKKESKKSTAQKELVAALDQVSKVFYSDKAQQLYELSLSLKPSDSAAVLAKLQEAARLEPDNMSIEIALGRQLMANGDCGGAVARVSLQKELLMSLEDLRLLASQASLCLGKTEEYLNLRGLQDVKSSPLAAFWQALETEYLLKTSNLTKAQDTAESLQKLDPSFPEAVYWKWKIEIELKQKSDKSAQKYLNLCKTLSSRQSRQYMAEPLLCRRMTEVETFLKKTNNSEI